MNIVKHTNSLGITESLVELYVGFGMTMTLSFRLKKDKVIYSNIKNSHPQYNEIVNNILNT